MTISIGTVLQILMVTACFWFLARIAELRSFSAAQTVAATAFLCAMIAASGSAGLCR